MCLGDHMARSLALAVGSVQMRVKMKRKEYNSMAIILGNGQVT